MGRLEAHACFERAIELEPTNARARFNPILYRDVVALDPEFADAHFNLALPCEQLGRWRRPSGTGSAIWPWTRAGEWAIAPEHLAGSRP